MNVRIYNLYKMSRNIFLFSKLLVAIVGVLSFLVVLSILIPPFCFYMYTTYLEYISPKLFSGVCTDEVKLKHASDAIPKVVHQTWKTKDIPEKWTSYRDECRQLNPGYEFKLWTDANIMKLLRDNYPWFVSTYEGYSYNIQRPDAARYFILHHSGGIYVDMDLKCRVPFDTILANIPKTADVLLAATDPFGITNNMMGAPPGHLYLSNLTSDLIPSNGWYITPHWSIMMSSGPLFVYKNYLKFQCKPQVHVLTVQQHKLYFQHDQAATWHQWDGLIMDAVDRYNHAVMILLYLISALVAVRAIRKCYKVTLNARRSLL